MADSRECKESSAREWMWPTRPLVYYGMIFLWARREKVIPVQCWHSSFLPYYLKPFRFYARARRIACIVRFINLLSLLSMPFVYQIHCDSDTSIQCRVLRCDVRIGICVLLSHSNWTGFQIGFQYRRCIVDNLCAFIKLIDSDRVAKLIPARQTTLKKTIKGRHYFCDIIPNSIASEQCFVIYFSI